MRTITKNVSRLYVATAVTAALFGMAVSSPAPVQARTQKQDALPECDPGFELCEMRHTYYATSSHVSVVGKAITDCNGVYTITYGYATGNVHSRYLPCP